VSASNISSPEVTMQSVK